MNNKTSLSERSKLFKSLEKKPIGELIANLNSKDADIKFQSSKVLILLSTKKPARIYPYFNEFVKLFENDNNIIKWTGIIVIGNLAKADKNKKIDEIMPKLFKLLDTGKMITAGNTSMALAKIALAKPDWQNKITSELLKVENYKYDTAECGNIAIGHVIRGFELYLKNPDEKVINFITRQTKNSRHATAQKAEKYLAKIKKQ